MQHPIMKWTPHIKDIDWTTKPCHNLSMKFGTDWVEDFRQVTLAKINKGQYAMYLFRYKKLGNILYETTERLSPSSTILLQSTLDISNSKGLSEILRDIRNSTYQICRIQENLIWLTTFNKYMCNCALEVRDILKILWKRGQFLLFSTIFFICC